MSWFSSKSESITEIWVQESCLHVIKRCLESGEDGFFDRVKEEIRGFQECAGNRIYTDEQRAGNAEAAKNMRDVLSLLMAGKSVHMRAKTPHGPLSYTIRQSG